MCRRMSLLLAMVSVREVTKCASGDYINNVYNTINHKGIALQQTDRKSLNNRSGNLSILVILLYLANMEVLIIQ